MSIVHNKNIIEGKSTRNGREHLNEQECTAVAAFPYFLLTIKGKIMTPQLDA
jgi:hypothetical protein